MTEHVELRFAPDTDADTGTFRGTASAYGVLDAHGTEFQAGAFAASIAERRADGGRFPLLLHHDRTRVAGVVEALTDTPAGLEIEGRFILDTEAGREGHALARRGALSLSVGFRRLSDRPRPGGGRIITEARLVEVSAVAVASNPRTRITEVRSTAARGAAHSKGIDMAEHVDAAPESRAGETETTDTADTGHETRAAVQTLTSTVAELRSSLDAERARLDRIEARSGRAGVTAPADTGATETRAFSHYLRTGTVPAEVRSMTTFDDTAGGYTVPETFIRELVKDLVEFSPVRSIARVAPTSGGNIVLPKRTDGTTATWTAETAARTSSEPQFGRLEFAVHELATYTDVSNVLLEDSGLDIAGELRRDLAEAFGKAEGTAFVSGSGAGQPLGLLNSGIDTVASGAASAITADGLISLLYALPSAYARRGTWGMNRATLAAVRKLKAGDGHYLWQDALSAGSPATILGRPVVELPDMPDVASSAYPIVFGDFSNFRVFDRVALTVKRDDYTQQANGLVRFHARRRLAAGVQKAEAFRLMVVSAS